VYPDSAFQKNLNRDPDSLGQNVTILKKYVK
jgi:hypothetical protein